MSVKKFGIGSVPLKKPDAPLKDCLVRWTSLLRDNALWVEHEMSGQHAKAA